MSKKDRQRHLRQLVCEGCQRRCRYADFRAFGRYAGGFAPPQKRDYKEEVRRRRLRREAATQGESLPHGNTGRRHGGQQEFAETARDAVATNETPAKVSTGTVLGRMHHAKMDLWLQFTENCPCYGEDEEDDAT